MSYLNELFSLRGKHAVVTGGSSGIGAAAAEALGRAGASVHVVARGQENLDATVARLTDLGVEASAASYDLADAAQLAELCATDDLRRADILVNCAGRQSPTATRRHHRARDPGDARRQPDGTPATRAGCRPTHG